MALNLRFFSFIKCVYKLSCFYNNMHNAFCYSIIYYILCTKWSLIIFIVCKRKFIQLQSCYYQMNCTPVYTFKSVYNNGVICILYHRVSWPSGHSSSSAYSFIFLAVSKLWLCVLNIIVYLHCLSSMAGHMTLYIFLIVSPQFNFLRYVMENLADKDHAVHADVIMFQ